jgi:hypothetical protein
MRPIGYRPFELALTPNYWKPDPKDAKKPKPTLAKIAELVTKPLAKPRPTHQTQTATSEADWTWRAFGRYEGP